MVSLLLDFIAAQSMLLGLSLQLTIIVLEMVSIFLGIAVKFMCAGKVMKQQCDQP